MSPHILNRDKVIVSKLAYLFKNPKRNDIIVVKKPADKRLIVKRITKTKNNLYFIEGDNKIESTDSNNFGWIKRKDIIGKVLKRI